MEGSCTFDLPCNVETETLLAKIYIYGVVKSIEVAGPFSVTRHGFFKRGFSIRNNENLSLGTNVMQFTARYWGRSKPKYHCSLICYSCITTPAPPIPTPGPTQPPTPAPPPPTPTPGPTQPPTSTPGPTQPPTSTPGPTQPPSTTSGPTQTSTSKGPVVNIA
ncbi:unnamed protein product [Mytilus coruscus]|uniref:Uncharacterized protein n=1 Tax=Mytilus coruscus TaxID=42192 RepID=A0A6J8CD40_MYTCO|nr:unnamed protein product [Mytilus coruscus]